MSLIRTLFVVALLVVVLSCRTEPSPEPTQYSVPAEIEPYVQTFRDEGSQRNRAIPTGNLIITFGKTQGSDVCGQCLLENGRTPRITISTETYCWKNASQYERECLILHELGHCLLNRLHRTERFRNGAYVSLMNVNDTEVYAICKYPINDNDCDKRPRRPYYLDELFDPTTLAPAWGQ